MTPFTLHLFAADRYEQIEGVTSFTGEDASGSFGLLARHDRFMTTLVFGLASLRFTDGSREYLGFPGGVLYFVDNELRISTRRFLRDRNLARLADTLTHELLTEEQLLTEARRKLQRLEAEMLRHFAQIGRNK